MEEILSYDHTACRQLSQMLFADVFFYASEYFLAVAIHGRSNASLIPLIEKSYLADIMFSTLEYILEIYYFPQLKQYWWISNLGLAMVLTGETLRKVAIIMAGRSFTLVIKERCEEHHKLVTKGVYGYVRHPGYCGYFIWSVGTQLMLCNPLSTTVVTTLVWDFLVKRIRHEELFLRKFFGLEYEEYAWRVPSGIPLVK